MADLETITALGAKTPRLATFGTLELRENADLALASLALRRGVKQPAPLGLSLPGPGGLATGEDIAALWTGPDQWMVIAQGRVEASFATELERAAPDCSVTDQTDGWVVFEAVSHAGPELIEALLSKLVNVNLADFGAGHATRTGLEHMSCFVIRHTFTDVLVLGPRSSAGSLWHALETAARRLIENGS